MSTPLPALFVSHGSPMLALEDGPARRFLTGLAADLPRPKAILVVSAHWETRTPVVSAASAPETIHDFGRGFPKALFAIRYSAPGAPELAARTAELLTAAGLPVSVHPDRGLDHGAWVPLGLAWPDADVPMTQLSIQPHLGPEWHRRLGEALRPLREEGVLIVASGALTHNLGEFFGRDLDAEAPDWVVAFGNWMHGAVTEGRADEALDYRSRAPHAARNHPTEEHLLPLFVAMGAGTPGAAGRRLHSSHTYGVLAMDAYAFD